MYIGVFGYNGGGVYNSAIALNKSMKYIHSPKKQEFMYFNHAINFVIKGLTEDYKICPRDALIQEKFYQNPNFFHYIHKLIKQNNIEAPFRYNY